MSGAEQVLHILEIECDSYTAEGSETAGCEADTEKEEVEVTMMVLPGRALTHPQS